MKYSILLILFIISSCTQKQEFTIGSGSKGAVYYPTAKTLCKNFNRLNKEYKCKPLTSKGAQKNLEDLENKKIDFAISQMALQNEYYRRKKARNIRSVMSLHHEHFTIIASKKSNIKSLNDLKGKRVNIGNPGSGSRIYFDKLMQLKRWKLTSFAKVYEESSSQLDDLLCSGQIDAAIYLVGHPNKIFKKIINKCDGVLIGLNKREKRNLKQIFPNFKNSVIHANIYKKQNYNVSTIGTPIILSAHQETNGAIVSSLVKNSKNNKKYLEQNNVIFEEINFVLPKYKPLYKRAPVHSALR